MTKDTPTPTPSTPDGIQRGITGLAALAHTDRKSHQRPGSDDAPTPSRGATPDDDECGTTGIAADTPASSKTSGAAEDSPSADGPETPPDGPQDGPEDGKGSKEAAKFRRQLRDVEADRDALAARLEVLQRQQVEARAESLGVRPAALWAAGVSVADLLGDDGDIDSGKLADAVAGVRETFGIRPAAVPRPRMFRSGASSPSTQVSKRSWTDAFSPKDQ